MSKRHHSTHHSPRHATGHHLRRDHPAIARLVDPESSAQSPRYAEAPEIPPSGATPELEDNSPDTPDISPGQDTLDGPDIRIPRGEFALRDDAPPIPEPAVDSEPASIEPSTNAQLIDPGLNPPTQIAADAVDIPSTGATAVSPISPDSLTQAADALKTIIPELLRQIVKNTANPAPAVIGP